LSLQLKTTHQELVRRANDEGQVCSQEADKHAHLENGVQKERASKEESKGRNYSQMFTAMSVLLGRPASAAYSPASKVQNSGQPGYQNHCSIDKHPNDFQSFIGVYLAK
jgi:hypothetical protein